MNYSLYDYLLVGSGLFSAVFAQQALAHNKRCLVVEKRDHIGGNCYTHKIENIDVHQYGAHIFHTSDKEIWDYICQFADMNHFVNSPIANYHGEIYNIPFNMNTFSKMWGIITPEQAKEKIALQSQEMNGEAQNLEEHIISMVGRDVYEKLVKGYTEKQWGRACSELPKFIIQRLPVRFTYDNNYFNDRYQGIPKGGYTPIFEKMFAGCDLMLNTDYNKNVDTLRPKAKTVIYTGTIDSYFDYCYGALDYRSLRFETEVMNIDNYQGVAVVNYTDAQTPYTRKIEHKHFDFGKQEKTVVSTEYPIEWTLGMEPYYPLNDEANKQRYEQYEALAKQENGVHFGGRLGSYRYYDMHHVIRCALDFAQEELCVQQGE